MQKDYCKYLSYLAQKAVLYEVSVTPKPGLVDRWNSGSHTDMDFYTFMASGSALAFGFYECALAGMEFTGDDLTQLLSQIRPVGIRTEEQMFKATNGVNTHKGIIFSLGIICAAAAHLTNDRLDKPILAEDVCSHVQQMTAGLSNRELNYLKETKHRTNGERLYVQYQLTGIRGEVESGFQTVRSRGLEVLRQGTQYSEYDLNNLLVQVLLNIMTSCEDTNVVARHDLKILRYVQNYAQRIMDSGGIYAVNGLNRIKEMDQDFISQNISPGGSADLLAVTLMLGMLENLPIR